MDTFWPIFRVATYVTESWHGQLFHSENACKRATRKMCHISAHWSSAHTSSIQVAFAFAIENYLARCRIGRRRGKCAVHLHTQIKCVVSTQKMCGKNVPVFSSLTKHYRRWKASFSEKSCQVCLKIGFELGAGLTGISLARILVY